MKYDKLWVAGHFLVVGLWAFVIISTLYVFIIPQNMLVNQDIDLRIPTLFLMSFSLIYLFAFMFVFIVYILKIDMLRESHMRIKLKKPTTNDLCSIIIPARAVAPRTPTPIQLKI